MSERGYLLREKNLTLERAYEMVQAAEATAEQMHVMTGEQAVCLVKTNSGRGQGDNQPLSATFARTSMLPNSVRSPARNVVSVARWTTSKVREASTGCRVWQ